MFASSPPFDKPKEEPGAPAHMHNAPSCGDGQPRLERDGRLFVLSRARLAEQARAIFAAHLDLGSHRVFFFGSRVQGTNSELSDIDIGVEGPREVPAAAIIAIREELDNLPTFYTFDVVDFRKVSPGFREEALKEVEYVN